MSIIKKRINQVIYTFSALLGVKSDDVFLISFPKSGNTWVKFILLNVLIEADELNADVSFKTLDETIPELSRDNLMQRWKYKILPRFIKSHLRYKKYFFKKNRALLIVRDPRDVMVSYFHYANNSYDYNFSGDFAEFIRNKKYGLEACILHQVSWQNKASALIRYEDLKTIGSNILVKALRKLQINVEASVIDRACANATFEKMKALEKSPKKYEHTHKKEYNFMRKGTGNQWVNYFTEADINYYNGLLKKYQDRYINYYES